MNSKRNYYKRNYYRREIIHKLWHRRFFHFCLSFNKFAMTLLHFPQSFSLSHTSLPHSDVPVICTQDKLHTFWVFKIMFRNHDKYKTRSTLSIHT